VPYRKTQKLLGDRKETGLKVNADVKKTLRLENTYCRSLQDSLSSSSVSKIYGITILPEMKFDLEHQGQNID
jgi:hypothetical protein